MDGATTPTKVQTIALDVAGTAAAADDRTLRLARWTAAASAVLTAAFLVALVATPLLAPLPLQWRGAAEYASTFSAASMVSLLPPLALAPVFVVLLSALRTLAPPATAASATAGLAFAAVYAAIITGNDLVQLTTVRSSLEHGRFDGLDPLVWTNPDGVFAPLELLGYGFQALAGLSLVPLFATRRWIDAWIRRLLWANAVIAAAGFGIIALGAPWLIFPGLVAWSLVFATAMVLLTRRLQAPIS